MLQIPYSPDLNEKQRQRVEAFNPMAGTLYSVKEASVLLDVSIRTVQRWLDNGTLKGFKIGGRVKIASGEIARVLHIDGSEGGGDNENR